jgi:hypothetical protein
MLRTDLVAELDILIAMSNFGIKRLFDEDVIISSRLLPAV